MAVSVLNVAKPATNSTIGTVVNVSVAKKNVMNNMIGICVRVGVSVVINLLKYSIIGTVVYAPVAELYATNNMIGMVACVSVVVLIDTFGMVSYVRFVDIMMKIERMKHGI